MLNFGTFAGGLEWLERQPWISGNKDNGAGRGGLHV